MENDVNRKKRYHFGDLKNRRKIVCRLFNQRGGKAWLDFVGGLENLTELPKVWDHFYIQKRNV